MHPVRRRHRAPRVTLAVLGACLGMLSAAPASAADSDWLTAREAFRKADDAALARATQAMQDSALAAYGESWLLWRRLKDAQAAEIRPFLAREQGSYVAERLRSEWLRQLARRPDWALFRQEYAQLQAEPDIELQCMKLQADIESGDFAALPAAKAWLWMTAKDQVAACDPAMRAMQARGIVTEEDRWQRFRLALDANAAGLARFLATSLGFELTAAQQKSLQDQPDAYIKQIDPARREQRELAAWAYGRWARVSPDSALTHLEVKADELGPQAALAWRQLAMAGARRFDPAAETWFARSDSAPWTDVQRETRLRQLVRFANWPAWLAQYDQLPANLRDSRGWQYWQAQALQFRAQQKDTGKAQAQTDNAGARRLLARLSADDDYYGLLALEQLGQALGPLSKPVQINDDDRARLARHAGFQRAFALRRLDQRWESASEFNWAVRTADDRLLLAAAQQADELGWHDRAIYAAERTKTLHEPRFRYLSPYREVTRGYARDMGLDEAWVFGLIRQESRFVTVARSSAGAGGLMQLMPGTAQWVANRLGIPYHAAIVNDIGQNVRLGTYYLNHVLTELGHPVLATAGYNAGPRRAREWQGDAALDATRYIESIPFGETRDYVKKVMTNAVHYARAFGQDGAHLRERLGTVPGRALTPIEGP